MSGCAMVGFHRSFLLTGMDHSSLFPGNSGVVFVFDFDRRLPIETDFDLNLGFSLSWFLPLRRFFFLFRVFESLSYFPTNPM